MIRDFIYNNRFMLTVLLIILLSITIIGGMNFVQANQSIEYDKSFTTIEVQYGDTLTAIAQEYAVSEAGYVDYIKEVKEINNLKDDTIHAGCYLMIPVYEIIAEAE
ncbi:MAG: LysM peptidoglycan-binding domain-containing protein [Bacteroidales bacterium]|nr:LysM peptidoglycan-binding domain-containing protein [Clostridium sp.]MCM1204707.1 LysM peptidoglycan-binding domain-containing protein [Bacteroidales bacterium]